MAELDGLDVLGAAPRGEVDIDHWAIVVEAIRDLNTSIVLLREAVKTTFDIGAFKTRMFVEIDGASLIDGDRVAIMEGIVDLRISYSEGLDEMAPARGWLIVV